MSKLTAPNLFCCRNEIHITEKDRVSEIESLFEKAVLQINSINQFSRESILKLHSLYNQATVGDINNKKCSVSSLPKAERDAWALLKGKSTVDAQREYVVLVHELAI